MLRLESHVLALVALAPLGGAQSVLYSTSFDDAVGWTLVDCWAVDATPATLGAHTGTNSLNCNDGAVYDYCFDDDATSPVIDLAAGVTGSELSFWCRWDTESDCYYDAKHVVVSDADDQAVLLDLCLLQSTTCPAPLVWHVHTVPLDPAWGQVQVTFHFDVLDDLFNGGSGWAVDDMSVSGECGPSIPYCTPKVNSAGCVPAILTTGVPSFSGASTAFRVQAQNVLNQHPGLMIWSFAEASTPFGGGTLCLGGLLTRTSGQSSGGNAMPPTDCSGTYSYNLTPEYMAAHGMTPGTTVHVQYWSRDSGFAAPHNMGLTAGMRVVICN
jgi:hypothetical protein